MARFERSKDRNKGSRGRSPRDDRGEKTFEGHMKRRGSRRGRSDSGRSPRRFGRRDIEMTKVICSDCGVECEVPFKPTSSKPVYCSECFEKQGKGGSNGPSGKDIDIINEKLDKIMKALKIK